MREAFEKWHMANPDEAYPWGAWQAAYKQAIEDAARMCEQIESQDRAACVSFHSMPSTCAAAIRKLAE